MRYRNDENARRKGSRSRLVGHKHDEGTELKITTNERAVKMRQEKSNEGFKLEEPQKMQPRRNEISTSFEGCEREGDTARTLRTVGITNKFSMFSNGLVLRFGFRRTSSVESSIN